MKKIILITLIAFSFTSFSQNHEKGKFLFTGSFSGPWSDISLPSTVGYYLTDALAITVEPSLVLQEPNGSFELDLGVRYHIGDRFFLNAEAKISDDGNNQTEEKPIISVGGNYIISIKDWASIDPGLSVTIEDGRTELAKSIGFSLYF